MNRTNHDAAKMFDGFSLFHTERAAEAALDQAVATHRATVITAFQNVADSLRALQNDADALKAATEFERAAKISLDLATQQMQSGNANIFLLLNAQQVYQQAIIGLVVAQANRLSDMRSAYRASVSSTNINVRSSCGSAGTKIRVGPASSGSFP